MSTKYTVKVNGAALFEFSTLGNAGTVHDKIKQRVPGVTVELVMPDGETLVNPTFPEALDFLAAKGFTVLDKSGKPPAVEPEPVPAKPAARKVTARTTRTTTATTPRKPAAPRKKVAAARK